MKVRILGCGTSGGVPRIDGLWGACDPNDPRNRRRRVSILVSDAKTRVLIDTSPDVREQLLDAGIKHLDAIFWTHDHADHSHGIDDIRGLFQAMKQRIPGYGDARTMAVLQQRFDYIFAGHDGYPPTITANILDGNTVKIGALQIASFEQIHGPIRSLGFRIGSFAYSTDLNDIPAVSEPYLRNLDVWIVDCLRYTPHPTHPHLDMTLGWIDKFKPKRAVLTHMNWDLDYATLAAQLPAGVEPGYDGMEFEFA
jgi:phosphoribosyl 1,2-cyclic phosphate phosphodiesterase